MLQHHRPQMFLQFRVKHFAQLDRLALHKLIDMLFIAVIKDYIVVAT
jgi:hypothetical protein